MAVRTNTTWSADQWEDANLTTASLERSASQADMAELAIGRLVKINLDVDQLLELSKAAELIANEIKESR